MARTVICTPMSIPPRFYNHPVLLYLAYNTPTIHQLYFWQFQIWGRHRRSAAQHTSACAYLTHSLSAKVPFPVIKCTPCEMQTSQLYHSMKWQMSRNSNHYEDREGLHPLSEQYCFPSRAYVTPNPLYHPSSLSCNHSPDFLTADDFACCITRTSYKWNHSFSMNACFHSPSRFVNTSIITSFQTHISPGTPNYQNHGYQAFFYSQWNTAGP